MDTFSLGTQWAEAGRSPWTEGQYQVISRPAWALQDSASKYKVGATQLVECPAWCARSSSMAATCSQCVSLYQMLNEPVPSLAQVLGPQY